MNYLAPSSNKMLAMQLLCWIAIVFWLFAADWQWIVLGLCMYVLYAGAGVALTFHRTLSHNSFKFNPIVKKVLVVIASLANVGSPITWVAIHRAHHKFCDTVKDPHSPLHQPSWFVLALSMYAKVSVKHVKDLLRDRFMLFVHKYYYGIQLVWIAILFYTGGLSAVAYLHLVPGGLTWLAGSFVNWYNHKYGYRVYATKDSSTNSKLTGFLVLGEGWHNAHHAQPIQPTTKRKWYELDTVYLLGKLLGGKTT